MSRIKIKDPNTLTGALYFVDPASKTNSKLARGMVVGIVTCLMAQGLEFEDAIQVIKPYMPKSINHEAMPSDWLKYFVDPKNVEVRIG